MAMKEWFRKMQPIQLYIVLVLTIAFFLTELIVSHLTHALTLLMDSYHMLCNILALTGCIITIKNSEPAAQDSGDLKKTPSVASSIGEELSTNPDPSQCHDKKKKSKSSPARKNQEKKLKNTFGWARIDVIVMLICCVLLASLSFSIFVEALQTLVHIDHHDASHHPLLVLFIGAIGMVLNGICYLLIGGYTFHQGSFLYVTESGDVVLNKVVVNDSIRRGERRLSRTKNIHSTILPPKKRQGVWEMTRDINGCVLVIICSLMIFFTDKDIAKYIDPLMSLVSVTIIMVLSYPYMKESGLILLQTIPATINIHSLKAELLTHFPDIVNVHDFHVWQLTASKVISTVHIIFENPKVYNKIMEEVKEFLIEKGITQVTIQPEFFAETGSTESLNSNKFKPECLMACQGPGCKQSHCCPNYEETSIFKTPSKEFLQEQNLPELKSVRVIDPELSVPSSMHPSCSGSSTSSVKVDEDITTTKDKTGSSNNVCPEASVQDSNTLSNNVNSPSNDVDPKDTVETIEDASVV
ncbi:zinc/cadmium resistance protein [Anoplophora glabripennis]|nr:zinc/cadmium resistance protein [Anoplophora glabripennis]XP_018560895.1 zinc/cadmium resistance protein [Anoplophora glabripennis]XP_018560896.1 zinc/cadmium resistance protein [Anoplophora glabripennis]